MPITSTLDAQPVPTASMWVKAVSLKVRQIDDRTYEVEGETGNHIVNVEDRIYSCSGCESFTYRAMCSHIAAVMVDRMENITRYQLALGMVTEKYLVSTEMVNDRLIIRAVKVVKKKRRGK